MLRWMPFASVLRSGHGTRKHPHEESGRRTCCASLVEPPGRTRIQIDVTPDVLELLDVVAGVTGSTRTGLVLEALMVALPGFVDRAETFVWLLPRLQYQGP